MPDVPLRARGYVDITKYLSVCVLRGRANTSITRVGAAGNDEVPLSGTGGERHGSESGAARRARRRGGGDL